VATELVLELIFERLGINEPVWCEPCYSSSAVRIVGLLTIGTRAQLASFEVCGRCGRTAHVKVDAPAA
jgi:hypothetical protein